QTANTDECELGRQTPGANVRRRKGNNPDHQLRSPNTHAGDIGSANADMSSDKGWFLEPEVADTKLPGKATKLQLNRTVPQTDTGGQDENSKALERTQEKELGKLTP
ncbi:unnamed protein product, partial [Phaeothamnion confervicola]